MLNGFSPLPENYIRLLKLLYRKSGDIQNCQGGNAKGVLQKAKKLIEQHRDDYSGYIIWFDGDTFFKSDIDLKNNVVSSRTDITINIYINEPCVENWLLAHFQPKLSKAVSSDLCERTLQQYFHLIGFLHVHPIITKDAIYLT